MSNMVDCCCADRNSYDGVACDACHAKARPVELLTVKALLTETALRRLGPGRHRFCPDAGCDVVYFDEAGNVFSRSDVRVPVWQKEPAGSRLVCYCFGENEADIRREIALTGASAAVQRVREHIGAGRCACEVRNPRGVCCLGDVAKAVDRMRTFDAPGARM